MEEIKFLDKKLEKKLKKKIIINKNTTHVTIESENDFEKKSCE